MRTVTCIEMTLISDILEKKFKIRPWDESGNWHGMASQIIAIFRGLALDVCEGGRE